MDRPNQIYVKHIRKQIPLMLFTVAKFPISLVLINKNLTKSICFSSTHIWISWTEIFASCFTASDILFVTVLLSAWKQQIQVVYAHVVFKPLSHLSGYSIWIPHTPCGRFKKHLPQGECEFLVDKLIWHFLENTYSLCDKPNLKITQKIGA